MDRITYDVHLSADELGAVELFTDWPIYIELGQFKMRCQYWETFLFGVNYYQSMSQGGPRSQIVSCGSCDGTGVYGAGECSVCNGRGQHRLELHQHQQVVRCKRCNGNGVVGAGICPNCSGVGKHPL